MLIVSQSEGHFYRLADLQKFVDACEAAGEAHPNGENGWPTARANLNREEASVDQIASRIEDRFIEAETFKMRQTTIAAVKASKQVNHINLLAGRGCISEGEVRRAIEKPLSDIVYEIRCRHAIRLIGAGVRIDAFKEIQAEASKRNDGAFFENFGRARRKGDRHRLRAGGGEGVSKLWLAPIDNEILKCWDSFEAHCGVGFANLPGLARWTDQAGSEAIAFLTETNFVSIDLYRMRKKRLGLRSQKPALVRSATRLTLGDGTRALETIPPFVHE